MLSFSGFSYQRQQERDRKEIKHMKNRLHVKAPGNWVNDPNGMIYYKGQYHLFYQHFPYAPRWGTMHWGHAVSPDLIHWEHVGVALFPSLSEDQNGCFSGSAVEENGVMHLFYTGVHYNQVNPKDIHQCIDQDFTSAQLHLTSKDGMQGGCYPGTYRSGNRRQYAHARPESLEGKRRMVYGAWKHDEGSQGRGIIL